LTHIMIDIETWGTRPGSAIRSIGACVFRPRGPVCEEHILAEFYVNVSTESCLAFGLTQDESTIKFWAEQGEAARAALEADQASIDVALGRLGTFFVEHRCEHYWGHGANFDGVLLEAAYHACGMIPPWKFWGSRCTRTLYDMAGVDLKSLPRQGTHHNALDDAKHQAWVAMLACERLFPPAPAAEPPEKQICQYCLDPAACVAAGACGHHGADL